MPDYRENVSQVLAPDGTPQSLWIVRRGKLPAEIVTSEEDALALAQADQHSPFLNEDAERVHRLIEMP